jgi:hypothetical protein
VPGVPNALAACRAFCCAWLVVVPRDHEIVFVPGSAHVKPIQYVVPETSAMR